MKPTIESWQLNPLEVGPLYPWVGMEVWMVLATALFCGYFLIWKIRGEQRRSDLPAGEPDSNGSSHNNSPADEEDHNG